MRLPTRVTVREVGPRDGLQAEPSCLPTGDKVRLINALSNTGLRQIEVTSFVHPKAIPQLADAEMVIANIERLRGVVYSAIVPNAVGAGRAIASKVDEMTVFFSASETHNRENVRMTVEQSLRGFDDVLSIARGAGVPVSAAMATAFGCPFEGDVPDGRVVDLVGRLATLGIGTVCLGDTTGMANPVQVYRLCSRLLDRYPEHKFILHFHNTRGLGMANILAGLQAGITWFDGSVGGLGGCPFAPGASGNVATEDIVHMFKEMSIETGVDLDKLLACAKLAQDLMGRELSGHVINAGVCGHLGC